MRGEPDDPYHYFTVFGLIIRSALDLPELERVPAGPYDVLINRCSFDESLVDESRFRIVKFSDDNQLLSWRDLGAFVIRGTEQIDVHPKDGIEDSMLALPLLGPVIAILLHLRGYLVLHASAVSLGDKGVIFVGIKGAGKSTTAGAFVRSGHQLLCDDVVAIELPEAGQPRIQPGIDRLKLWDDAANSLALGEPVASAGLYDYIPKNQYKLSKRFKNQRVDLAAVCVLSRGESASLTELSHHDGFGELVRHSYAALYGNSLLQGAHAERHFRLCAQVVSRAKIVSLVTPKSLVNIDVSIDLVSKEVNLN